MQQPAMNEQQGQGSMMNQLPLINLQPTANQQPIMIQKPIVKTTTVKGKFIPPLGSGRWYTSLFDCFEDCGTCCLSCLLPCFQYGKNKSALDGSGVFPNCLMFCCISQLGIAITNREQVRFRSGVEGSCLEDTCIHLCCSPCALTQEKRQIDYMRVKAPQLRNFRIDSYLTRLQASFCIPKRNMSFPAIRQFIDVQSGPNSADEKLDSFLLLTSEVDFSQIDTNLFESLMDTLKRSLVSSNSKVNQVCLQCLPLLINRIFSTSTNLAYHIKTLMNAIFANSVEKFGDNKQNISDSAVEVCSCFYRLSCPTQIQVLSIMDKEIKTNGFGHKLSKGKENTLNWFAATFNGGMHIKQYIPYLVSSLQDSSEAVRTLSKKVIVDLISQYNTKNLKLDFQKEMEKQNIRKSIVESIFTSIEETPELVEVVHVQSGTSASTPTPINFASSKIMEIELLKIISTFNGKEDETNWQLREKSLQLLRSIFLGNACSFKSIESHFKAILECTFRCSTSLRTTMVISSCLALTDLFNATPYKLDNFAENIVGHLMKLIYQTKKLVCNAGSDAMFSFLANSSYNNKIVGLYSICLEEKNVGSKNYVIKFILKMLNYVKQNFNGYKTTFDKSNGVEVFEKVIKKGLSDASPLVREGCREAFSILQDLYSERMQEYVEFFLRLISRVMGSLEPSVQKLLSKTKVPAKKIGLNKFIKKQRMVTHDEFVEDVIIHVSKPLVDVEKLIHSEDRLDKITLLTSIPYLIPSQIELIDPNNFSDLLSTATSGLTCDVNKIWCKGTIDAYISHQLITFELLFEVFVRAHEESNWSSIGHVCQDLMYSFIPEHTGHITSTLALLTKNNMSSNLSETILKWTSSNNDTIIGYFQGRPDEAKLLFEMLASILRSSETEMRVREVCLSMLGWLRGCECSPNTEDDVSVMMNRFLQLNNQETTQEYLPDAHAYILNEDAKLEEGMDLMDESICVEGITGDWDTNVEGLASELCLEREEVKAETEERQLELPYSEGVLDFAIVGEMTEQNDDSYLDADLFESSMPTHFVDTSYEDSKLTESLPVDILKFRDLARSVIGDSYHFIESESEEVDMASLLDQVEESGITAAYATNLVNISRKRTLDRGIKRDADENCMREPSSDDDETFWNSHFERLMDLILSGISSSQVRDHNSNTHYSKNINQCLWVLESLLSNQTSYFLGIEHTIMATLIDLRRNQEHSITAIAHRLSHVAAGVLDKHHSVDAVLRIIESAPEEGVSDIFNMNVLMKNLNPEPGSFTIDRKGFTGISTQAICLEMLCLMIDLSCDVSKVVDLCAKSMASKDILVRKTSVECFAKVAKVFGKDALFEMIVGKLDRFSEMVVFNFVSVSESTQDQISVVA